MQFVDAHCHLHFARVARVARPLLQNAKEKGITHFAVNATSPNDFALVCSLAQSDDSVIPFYGVHPYYIQEGTWEHDYAQLVSMKEKLRYIGEIGMDKTIASRIPMAFQASCFRKQVQLAVSLSIPFAVHCVRCVQDVYSVLEEEGPFACPFLMHGYSGSPDYVSKLVELGAYFSISGYFLNVSPKRRKAMDDTIRKIPLDRLLFESDAPDMWIKDSISLYDDSGVPINSPLCIMRICSEVAAVKQMTSQELATIVYQNSKRFYHL